MNEHMYLEEKNETMGENSFMKKLLKKRLNQKGLTLIELLAVIVILAIVAAIAVPAIGNIIENSRYNAVKGDATNVLSASQLYFTENAEEEYVTVGALLGLGYLESAGELPATSNEVKSGSTAPTASATESFVAKISGGNQLTTSAIEYSGSKTITFSSATLEAINGDTFTGSTDTTKVINTTAATNAETAIQ
ncbi:prepilin-type N-terminal cleavage/methylation domain-containing protein [Chryseomicrobium sp. FSL W7-1435]|uniref:type II secretion system protein n=2 Tax=Chryseomicrobium sp. FSL W7-1435 TaxID=2921704 RepID=UPI003159D176